MTEQKPHPLNAHEVDVTTAYTGQQSAAHRGPHEAGSADRYYGRPCKPNFAFNGTHFTEDEMTPEQVKIYVAAWNAETDRKNWKK